MQQNLLWWPDKPTEFSTLYTNKSTDRLRPGELSQVSNMSYEALGALKKIRGNSEIATSTVTQSTDQTDDTSTVDVYWYSSTAYNGSFLKKDYIGIKFKDSFFAALSGTVSSAQLQITTATADTFTGTLYLATSSVSESGSVPTYSTSTSVAVSGSGVLSTITLTIPAAWITSMISSNLGMVLVYSSGAGFFISSSDIKVRYFAGGTSSGDTIDFVDRLIDGNINGSDCGNLTSSRYGMGGYRGSSYSFFSGGSTGSASNIIDYLAISTSSANATDSGDLTVSRYFVAGLFGSTYGFTCGGYTGSANSNVIDYTILANATGNATDTGDLTVARRMVAGVSGSTYGFVGGGVDGSSYSNVIDYITLATTTQNAIDTGDLTTARGSMGGCMGSTYGYFGGGVKDSFGIVTSILDIDKITLATTTQNSSDVGNLTDDPETDFLYGTPRSAASGGTSGIFAGVSLFDAMLFSTDAVTLNTGSPSVSRLWMVGNG